MMIPLLPYLAQKYGASGVVVGALLGNYGGCLDDCGANFGVR